LTDDLAWNLVQYMPHVLQMQKDGITFTNYFVTNSPCCPSRSSIFTGRYPHNTGIYRDDCGYSAFHNRGYEATTFAVALAAAGYRTAMLGKYLNGYRAHRPRCPRLDGLGGRWRWRLPRVQLSAQRKRQRRELWQSTPPTI
jgi:N-acetylglucosamine-6-sulfatase